MRKLYRALDRQANEANALAIRQQEMAKQCRMRGNSAHDAYKTADRAARDERARATHLNNVAADRRSEFFLAQSMQQSAEAPQSWGLPRELRQESIVRTNELEIADHMARPIISHQLRAAKNDLTPGQPDGISEKHRRTLAQKLAKAILARTHRLAVSVPCASNDKDGQTVQALPSTDDDELSAEDLALQQSQFVQFAMAGTTASIPPHYTVLADTCFIRSAIAYMAARCCCGLSRALLPGNIDFGDLAHASSIPTVLKLINIPQLVQQACQTISAISENTAASDIDAVQQLAAPPMIMALADVLASERRSDVCAAAKAVGALARHDTVREMLFTCGIVVMLHKLLVTKPPICAGAASMHARRSVPRLVLDSIVDSAVFAANRMSTAVFRAATAIVHAENAPERNEKRTQWFAARPCPSYPELHGWVTIGENEAAHRLAVWDRIAMPFDSTSASVAGIDAAATLQSSTRRYDARVRAARRARLRESNWIGGSRCPVFRNPSDPTGGATERERNLRIERAQRADLQLYRNLTMAAEERNKLGLIRVAEARLKKRLGISTAPP